MLKNNYKIKNILKSAQLPKNEFKTTDRSLKITNNFINKTIHIHNGIKYIPLVVTEKMVGMKLGEFSPTRKKPIFKVKK